jgi:hypothetical protein
VGVVVEHEVLVTVAVHVFLMTGAMSLGAVALGGLLSVPKADCDMVYRCSIEGLSTEDGHGDDTLALQVDWIGTISVRLDVDGHKERAGAVRRTDSRIPLR